MSATWIGVSGWRYRSWRGPFYPRGLAQRLELQHLSRRMNSVEINGSFYSLQRPESYRRWHDETPEEFRFAVKGSRFITHLKQLRDVEPALANFFASGMLALRGKIGPILWQLPPRLKFDGDRIAEFLALLPHTTAAAADLAGRHDERLDGRALTVTDDERPLRHAMEIRHDSFRDPAFPRLLREHGVALVVADTAGRWPLLDEPTADFAYARLHGSRELYVSGYTSLELAEWTERIERWRADGRDVHVYFDNDTHAHAPHDAIALASLAREHVLA